jgi:UDPglucose 6-dehydrogenase
LRIGVIGYGTVGGSLVRFFERRKHSVSIYDKYLDGYRSERDVEAVNDVDLVFIAVPTPYDPRLGAADLSAVYDAISLVKSAPICIKSTIPPGSFNALERFIPRTLAYSPEYVGESKNHPWPEIDDCGFVVAAGHDEACALVRDAFCNGEDGLRFVRTDVATAELAKYMANCFLATKVAFVNQFWDLAQASGVDYEELRKIFLLDGRVGESHTVVTPERGFGGRCLPKDLSSIIGWARDVVPVPILEAVRDYNDGLHERSSSGGSLRPEAADSAVPTLRAQSQR